MQVYKLLYTSSMQSAYILGVPIHAVTKKQAGTLLQNFALQPQFRLVCTPNNEMLVYAQKDPAFLQVLRSADLAIPDSTGLLLAAKMTGQYLPERVTGVDTMTTFCTQLPNSVPVFFLGAAPGIAEKAANVLKSRNPHLHIAGTYSGSPAAYEAEHICNKITQSGAQVLFVAFGAPKQEIWLQTYKNLLPHVHIAMGVGGSFDFIAGVIPRAPRLFQRLGLEWLYRLWREPKRLPRIWRATAVFMWYVVRSGKQSIYEKKRRV